MKFHKKSIVILNLFVLLSASELLAQGKGAKLSFEQVVELTMQNNRDLVAARWIIKEAQGRLKQSGLWPNPELQLGRTSDRVYNNEGEYTASAGFFQKFPISGRLSKAKKLARVDVALAFAEIRDKERLIIRETLSSLFDICITQKQLTFNTQSQSALHKLIKISERRLRQAEISEADLNLEKIELQRIDLAIANLKISLERAFVNLNALLGNELPSLRDVDCKLESHNLENLLNVTNKQAILYRPDYQLVSLQNNRANAELQLAKAETYQDWTIGIAYDRDVSNFDFVNADNQKDEFLGLKLSIPLPLWNQNEGRIAEVQASRHKTKAAIQALETQIIKEVDSARAKVIGLQAVIKQYQNQSLNLAEHNAKLLSQSYRDGLLPISAVIQGQQQLFEVRQSYSITLREYHLGINELEFALAANPLLKRGSNE